MNSCLPTNKLSFSFKTFPAVALLATGVILTIIGIWQLQAPFIAHSKAADGLLVGGGAVGFLGAAAIAYLVKKSSSVPILYSEIQPIRQAPKDVWMTIFDNLDSTSLLAIGRACKYFYMLTKSDLLWKKLGATLHFSSCISKTPQTKSELIAHQRFKKRILTDRAIRNKICVNDLVEAVLYKDGLLFAGLYGGNVSIWKYGKETQKHIKTFQADKKPIECILYIENMLLTRSNEGTVKVWNEKWNCIQTLSEKIGEITSLFYNENQLFAGAKDHKIYIWEKQQKQWTTNWSLEGHTGEVTELSAGKNLVFSSTNFGEAKIWSKETLECLKEINLSDSGGVEAFCYAKEQLFFASYNQTIQVWDVEFRKYEEIANDYYHLCRNLVYIDGLFIYGTANDSFKLLDANTWKCVKENLLENNAYCFSYGDGKLFIGTSTSVVVWS